MPQTKGARTAMATNSTVEGIKLFATFFNNIAVAWVAAGVIGPIVGLIYDYDKFAKDFTMLWSLPVICVCMALALHLAGQYVLLDLEKFDES
jgi:MFS-type transporter involved in bile tolerance (Atg22 family)